MRSLARETVFKFLFAQLFNPSDEELFAVLIKDDRLNDQDRQFASDLLDVIQNNKQKYLDIIRKMAEGFTLSRLFASDKCALLIGLAELDNFKETPVVVAIDEAVKLAAKFSTEKSTDFVNGLLAEYAREMNNG